MLLDPIRLEFNERQIETLIRALDYRSRISLAPGSANEHYDPEAARCQDMRNTIIGALRDAGGDVRFVKSGRGTRAHGFHLS